MAKELNMPLPEAIATVTSHPARISNLDDRGSIKVGKRADLVRVTWDPPLPVVKKCLEGRAANFLGTS